jgi:hypothetical protein
MIMVQEGVMPRRKSTVAVFTLLILLVLPLAADQKPSFVFGGKQIFIGMKMSEAVQLLSDCCLLSPPMENKIEEKPAHGGHFIAKKDQPEVPLGTIYFDNQQITRMTRPVADYVDFSNDDLVAFIRALKRVLQDDAGNVGRRATISVTKENPTNAEVDHVLIKFDDGRGIEIAVGMLDKPNQLTNRRDFVTADETLEQR